MREWLRLNGASDRSLASAFISGSYDLAMAYEAGDPARPRLSAAVGLRAMFRMYFTYRGALYRMDGTTIIDGSYSTAAVTSTQSTMMPTRTLPVYLTAGQYVELAAYHNATGALSTLVTAGHQSRFNVVAG